MSPDDPNETPTPADMEGIWEEFAERAAILQYESGMSMQEAETLALEAVIRRRARPQPSSPRRKA